MSERLQKFLARAGVASRRHAEGLITAGRVSINNERVTELGTKVDPGDLVAVDGKLVSVPEEKSYYLLYKPEGVVTTMEDPQGRPTVADFVTKVGTRLFPVGRLDYDAEGALLFTDDGELANKLTHPRYEVRRTYLAKVKGTPDEKTLEKLLMGVRLEDGMAQPLVADIFEHADKNTWLKLVVAEGRPHLIKRLCAAIGHPVLRLFRPAHGGVSVQGMKPGDLRRLSSDEVEQLHKIARGEAAAHDGELKLPARRHGHGPALPEGAESPRPQGAQSWKEREEGGARTAFRGERPFKQRGKDGLDSRADESRGRFGGRRGAGESRRGGEPGGGFKSRGGFEARGGGSRGGFDSRRGGEAGGGYKSRGGGASRGGYKARPGGESRGGAEGGYKSRGGFESRGGGEGGGYKPRGGGSRGGFESRGGEGGGYKPRGGGSRGRFEPRGGGESGGGGKSRGGFESRRGDTSGGFKPRGGGSRGGFESRRGHGSGGGGPRSGGFKPRGGGKFGPPRGGGGGRRGPPRGGGRGPR